MYRNTSNLAQKQIGVIVTGSWLTVKEQMPAAYAQRLAEKGHTAFTFDFTGFGQSSGEPRQAEIPDRKIADLLAATDFLSTFSGVESDNLAHVAVCASAQYGVAALARGSRIGRFASIAGWFHDAATVAPFYGGADGVAARLASAREAMGRYAATGQVDQVLAYRAGDPAAGMSSEMDYYGSAVRGAVPAWHNSMATMSWWYWLTYDGLSAARHVVTPALFVHGDECVLPDNLRTVYESLQGPKQLEWMDGTQTDFYDRSPYVDRAVDLVDTFLRKRFT